MTDPSPDLSAIEERLRKRLAEQAEQVQPSEGLAAGVYQRQNVLQRRRSMSRLTMSMASVALVVGVGFGLLSQTNASPTLDLESGAPTAEEESPDSENACTQPRKPNAQVELVVWLDSEVPDAAVSELAEVLSNTPTVLDVRYVDREETYAEFREYYSDQPEIVSLVTADELPTSFRVVVENQRAEIEFDAQMTPWPHVLAVDNQLDLDCSEIRCQSRSADAPSSTIAIIWLDPGLDQPKVDEIHNKLDATSGIVSVDYQDQAGLYREFQESFVDESGGAEVVEPEELPTSFVVEFDDEPQAMETAPQLEASPGPEVGPEVEDVEHLDADTAHHPLLDALLNEIGTLEGVAEVSVYHCP